MLLNKYKKSKEYGRANQSNRGDAIFSYYQIITVT